MRAVETETEEEGEGEEEGKGEEEGGEEEGEGDEEGKGEEQGEDEEQDRAEKQRGKQKAGIVSSEKQQYYTWSSTGTDTETEDEGPINQDRDWAAMEEGTSGETTEEEEGTEEHKTNNIE